MRNSRRQRTTVIAALMPGDLDGRLRSPAAAHRPHPSASHASRTCSTSIRPKMVKRASLGFDGLMACIYWTRTVQYFGHRHYDRAHTYNELAPLLEITTALDPHLFPAYQFGASFLAPQPPDGAGEPDRAIQLMEYGIEHNPDNWQLYYNLGFVYYTELKDYRNAAEVFERGSKVPNAHPFMKIMAAQMAAHAGDFATARMLWSATYETAQEANIRQNAVEHLRAIQVDEDVTNLEAVGRAVRPAHRACFPAAWQNWSADTTFARHSRRSRRQCLQAHCARPRGSGEPGRLPFHHQGPASRDTSLGLPKFHTKRRNMSDSVVLTSVLVSCLCAPDMFVIRMDCTSTDQRAANRVAMVDVRRRYEGSIAATRRLLGVLWEFARDSTPERLRPRFGDADYDWDHRVNTTSGAVGWRDRLLGMFHSAYQPTEPAAFHEMLDASAAKAATVASGDARARAHHARHCSGTSATSPLSISARARDARC